MNREFVGKKLVNSIIILSYVVPAVCLIFAWRYMFNNIYGIINYIIVDVLKLADEVPLWFDQPASAFILVTIFAIWKFYPYAYMSFVAILQSVDKSLYEAADMDGATSWQKFLQLHILPSTNTGNSSQPEDNLGILHLYGSISPDKQVNVLGVYLYDMALPHMISARQQPISIVLFVVIFSLVMLIRKKVLRVEED